MLELRSQINQVDAGIIKLLAQRRKLSEQVIRIKDSSQIAIRDPEREQDLLVTLIKSAKELGLDSHFVSRIFHEIIEDSVRIQWGYLQDKANAAQRGRQLCRVAIPGIEGSYSYSVAERFFADRSDALVLVKCASFSEAIKAAEDGKAEYVVVPIENTTSGGINEVYDLLLHTQLSIVGEKKLRIEHCLVAKPGSAIGSIKKVLSHPQGIVQCSNFLTSLGRCEVEYCNDTATAAKRVHDEGKKGVAAIASEEAANVFGLSILKRDIANQPHNFTRFIVASRKPIEVDLRIPCKTSLIMATAQRAGSLVEALLVLRESGLSMTKLESRPIIGNPWEEMFYLDFEGNIADLRVQGALEEVSKYTRFMKVLGSYPADDLRQTELSQEALSAVASSQEEAKDAPAAESSLAEQVPAKPKKSTKKGYRLASRDHKSEDTIISVKGVNIGGDAFVVIAGPCAVESHEQIMTCAHEVKEYGGAILRGGCFKPRSSPYSFQGLGYEGLSLLVQAGETFSLPVVTEVLAPEDVDRVAERADILQVGARNMQNFTLLKAMGRTHRPVMLKRGLMASIDELLQAAEYILAQGNHQVFLCERGIRTFETATRNTLDLSAVPILKGLTHLPVIVDPSHAAGERDLVLPLARAAKAVGAHGIMIEIHPEPEKALSDGPQALFFPQFESLMGEIFRRPGFPVP